MAWHKKGGGNTTKPPVKPKAPTAPKPAVPIVPKPAATTVQKSAPKQHTSTHLSKTGAYTSPKPHFGQKPAAIKKGHFQ